MERMLIAGQWIDDPDKNIEKESAIYFETDGLLLIQKALLKFKESENSSSVGFTQRNNVIAADRILSVIQKEIYDRSKK